MVRQIFLCLPVCLATTPGLGAELGRHSDLATLISHHAQANGVPEALVHRVVQRESRYNPRAIGRGGALGLMQIKYATARGLGYGGPPSGLLDANTNLTYAVPYLAGAYRVANGDHRRAVAYYASGYYYAAKRQGMLRELVARSQGRAAFAGLTTTARVEITGSIERRRPVRMSKSAPGRSRRDHWTRRSKTQPYRSTPRLHPNRVRPRS